MSNQIPYRLGALLVCRGFISEEQLVQAVIQQRSYTPPKPLGKVLIDMGIVTEKQISSCLQRQKCLRWYAAAAALISAPSAAFCQDMSIEDLPEFQHTQVSQVDSEGFHLDAKGHKDNILVQDTVFQGNYLSGSNAVDAAMKTAAKVLWNSYAQGGVESTQFDFSVSASENSYGVKMIMSF